MSQHLTILTGASRGMGLAMAEQLIDAGHFLLSIARHPDETLAARAKAHGAGLEQWTADLQHPEPVAARLEAWLRARAAGGLASATLINNAGVMPPIAFLADISAGDLAQSLRVNLEAPMLLTSTFLRATHDWNCPRKVLNISSGLGRRAMASQAPYCAAKAGMDHFTRCVALEEAQRPNGAKVCSLAPGVIDTDMQVQLRHADPGAFPDVGYYKALKDKHVLTSPLDAAARVLAYLQRLDFGREPVGDVRD